MGRNNERNIKKHNDKLHKAQNKVKQAEIARKEKLKEIIKKFNEDKKEEQKGCQELNELIFKICVQCRLKFVIICEICGRKKIRRHE